MHEIVLLATADIPFVTLIEAKHPITFSGPA
jgi:hypothetical protein